MTNITIEQSSETHATAIALRCIRQMYIGLAAIVLAIVFLLISVIALVLDLPSVLAYVFCAAAFLMLSISFFCRADNTKQSHDTLLCNECNLAAYRQVMNLEKKKAPLRRYAHGFALNSLAASITLGDYDEAHKEIAALDTQYDSLKAKHKFELDLHKWELDLAETPGDEARHEQADKDLIARWKNPPKGVRIQEHLKARELHRYADAGDWNSFGTALATMPISSVLLECNYHWLHSLWCAGTGASTVPDLTFVAEHGGDMLVATEARKKLAELPEKDRDLSAEQHIISCAPRVSAQYKRYRRAAILLLLLSLVYLVLLLFLLTRG